MAQLVAPGGTLVFDFPSRVVQLIQWLKLCTGSPQRLSNERCGAERTLRSKQTIKWQRLFGPLRLTLDSLMWPLVLFPLNGCVIVSLLDPVEKLIGRWTLDHHRSGILLDFLNQCQLNKTRLAQFKLRLITKLAAEQSRSEISRSTLFNSFRQQCLLVRRIHGDAVYLVIPSVTLKDPWADDLDVSLTEAASERDGTLIVGLRCSQTLPSPSSCRKLSMFPERYWNLLYCPSPNSGLENDSCLREWIVACLTQSLKEVHCLLYDRRNLWSCKSSIRFWTILTSIHRL